MTAVNRVEERRTEARKLFWETQFSRHTTTPQCLDAAIENATQARISADVIDAAIEATLSMPIAIFPSEMTAALTAALGALGFEVVE